MDKFDIMALIKRKRGTIILWGVLFASLAFLFLSINEKNFKVSTDYLVIQNQTGTQDYYSLSKSAEYISKIMSESVHSELFIDEVVSTGKVGKEFLPFEKKKKMEEWGRIIKVKRNFQSGMIGIEVLGDKQKETVNISRGIAEIMTTRNNLFIGEGQNINVKILSGPITEKNPGLKNIVLIVFGGFVFGILISFLFMYYKEEGKFAMLANLPEVDYEKEEDKNIAMDPEDYEESLKYLNDQR